VHVADTYMEKNCSIIANTFTETFKVYKINNIAAYGDITSCKIPLTTIQKRVSELHSLYGPITCGGSAFL